MTERYLLNKVWAAMRHRCRDRKRANYGGRGIAVCPEWENSFKAFSDWAHSSGYEEGLTLDRVDNDLGYCPENCRWTTPTMQSRNRRSAKGSSSAFIGVYRCTKRQVWVAQITVDKRKKTLGLFQTDREAAIARDTYIAERGLTGFTSNHVL